MSRRGLVLLVPLLAACGSAVATDPYRTTTTHKATTTTEATTSTSTSTTSASTTTTSTTTSPPTSTSTTTSTTVPEDTTTTSAPPTTTTTTEPGTTTTTNPDLIVNLLSPICDGDVPYLSYDVSFTGATVVQRITFINPDGEDFTYLDRPLVGRVLWPGAVVDDDGNPLDWPGWTQLPDGTWVEGDEWDWVRPSVVVEIEVNPTVQRTVGYPPASPVCDANPPPNPTPTTTVPGVTTTTPGLPPTR